MALPIFGRFMRAVYDDPKLNYSQSARFEFPADINICGNYVPEAPETVEQTVEGYFD